MRKKLMSGVPSLEQLNENSNMSSVLSSDNETGHNEAGILPDISSSDDEENLSPKTNKDMQSSGNESLKEEYEKQLRVIRTKKLEQELRVHNASNPHLKERFQVALKLITQQEEQVVAELDQLM